MAPSLHLEHLLQPPTPGISHPTTTALPEQTLQIHSVGVLPSRPILRIIPGVGGDDEGIKGQSGHIKLSINTALIKQQWRPPNLQKESRVNDNIFSILLFIPESFFKPWVAVVTCTQTGTDTQRWTRGNKEYRGH